MPAKREKRREGAAATAGRFGRCFDRDLLLLLLDLLDLPLRRATSCPSLLLLLLPRRSPWKDTRTERESSRRRERTTKGRRRRSCLLSLFLLLLLLLRRRRRRPTTKKASERHESIRLPAPRGSPASFSGPRSRCGTVLSSGPGRGGAGARPPCGRRGRWRRRALELSFCFLLSFG